MNENETLNTAEKPLLVIPDVMCSCGLSNESPKVLFFIERVDYKTAMDLVVENHYLHRKAPCSFAFGLFCKQSKNIIGVVIYGTPSSAPLRSGICGLDEKNNVIELTRLWIKDGTPKNTESFLIGNTIGKVDKEIIVSYAEIQQGHTGIVYQATNWIYTGLSAKRTNWTIEGNDKHCQTIADKYTAVEIREKYGDKFSLVDRPRKHRYVFFNCKPKRKKELLGKLKYKIENYPKKNRNMEQEVAYWEVTFRNTESNERWTVVKCPIEMDEYEIMSRMMDDSEVAQVYSAVETSMTDYGRDFTTEAE